MTDELVIDTPDSDGPEDDDGEPDTSASEALKQRRVRKSGGRTAAPLGNAGKTTSNVPRMTIGGAPKRILAQQKRRDAIELRKMGVPYQTIADAVGYPSAREAAVQVKKGMEQIIHEPVIELREIQIERYNHLLSIAWQQAQAGSLQAVQVAASLMDQLNKLTGTEAPQRVEVTTTNNTSIIAVTATQDDFINGMKKMLNIDANGQNPSAALGPGSGQVIPIAPSTPVTQPSVIVPTTSADRYPPGMGPKVEDVPPPLPEPMKKVFVVQPDDDEE